MLLRMEREVKRATACSSRCRVHLVSVFSALLSFTGLAHNDWTVLLSKPINHARAWVKDYFIQSQEINQRI